MNEPNIPDLSAKPMRKPGPRRQKPNVEPMPTMPGQLDPELFAKMLAEQKLEAQIRELEMFGPNYIAASKAAEAKAIVAELARRQVESLRLYESLPEQERFHFSRARIRLLRGSNRGGKTLPAAVEVARAVCGFDPHGKYPKTDGRWFCVGKDLKHIGQVMWRKLGRAGAYKIIRDPITKQWRTYRPWEPQDLMRHSGARPAPPLIPPRLIEEIGWENKKEGIPNVVRLRNGWEISFFSSLGKPPQGSDIDGWWMDEEIVDPEWFPEMSSRTLDRQGVGIWSATPQSGTDQLYELHERAEKCMTLEDRPVEEFVILLKENPHIQEKEKRELAENLSEEDKAVRIEGDFAIITMKVYPSFSMYVHGVDYQVIPQDWTRYMIVDPGFQVCAVLFCAVPPKEFGDHIYLYDELYIHGCDAAKFGEQVSRKAVGQYFQAFIIDPHMGIHTEMGSGKTVSRQYSDALRRHNIASHTTGNDFILGSDDVQAGLLAVQEMLRIRPDGTTRLRVLKDALPNFEYEIKRYHRKRENGVVIDKPDQRKRNHLMDDLRYMALYNPRWVKPRVGVAHASGAMKALRQKQARQRQKSGGNHVNLGPGK